MIPFNEEPGYGGIEMSKADKMFEELGYECLGNYFQCEDRNDYILFNEHKTKIVDIGESTIYTIELHIAITEKIKELGWIE